LIAGLGWRGVVPTLWVVQRVALVANGPGTATLTATAAGFTKSRRINVASAPLPLDAIRANLDPETDLFFQNDTLGSLAALEAPVGEPVVGYVTATRDERSVYGIKFQISTSAPGIVLSCGGLSTCQVQDEATIGSVSPEDAEITISARNLTTGFTVHVVEAP